ncbi:MAG: ATP-binding protein [Patescibacteria group bacterium]|nr:ATP-binding protein [Patescibacteria group bacterium]
MNNEKSYLGEELEAIRSQFEEKIKKRTKELQERVEELKESRRALVNILEDFESARTLAEEERDKTLTIIENFPEGLLLFDRENNLSSINSKARSIFKVAEEELTGKSIDDLKKVPSFSPLIKILREEIREAYQEELKLRENLIFEISVIPVKRKREKIGTLVMLKDVTRERIIERLKTEFVSIAAHQLRTPLSAIKWTLRMILDEDLGKVPKEQREFLEKTYQSNERMIHLINDLLNVTRIEEGRFLYNVQKEDIIKVVKRITGPLKEMAQRKGVKFEFKVPEEKLPKIDIDGEKISLALENLIENAIFYTKEGKVEVSLKFNKEKKEVQFSVKDTGIGIPQSQQKRVFTRFFRAATAIRAETEGTGLGLFIAKNIIEAHEGKIWFESAEGKGSNFYFTLPVKN